MSQGILDSITNLVLYPDFEGFLLLAKSIFIVVSLVFLGGISVLFFSTTWSYRAFFEDASEAVTARPYGAKKAYREWLIIKSKVESSKERERKLALIQADNLLEEILDKMGYKGNTLEERLSAMDKVLIPNLDEIRKAHSMRNSIVYNPDTKLDASDLREALSAYDKAFQEMEIF